ncbi:signal peptidase II [Albidovulum inexpectatum]|uniref:Lipoprotein signal peptidase n=1 Tax=Albidovulum inexpectatum TaxID=196587 RepID=A0A2S5JMF0_9RHOB|nr:signal peptidase II [Albidovulum inexpectatum]PPB82578.1 signal peptidase II [Albidovulum inexpectatum]
MKVNRAFWWSMAATLAADQVSKFLVVHWLDLWSRQVIAVIPGWLKFHMAWNQGINFGLLSGSSEITRWTLIGVAIAVSIWVFSWARREPHNRVVQLSAGLLIGGALGNVIDRIAYGAVADFLNVSIPGIRNPWSFNIADIAIFVGAFGLVLFSGRNKTP